MSRRSGPKTEEQLRKGLRDAQRRPENKRCADCTERLPQYVIIDYSIFVCTACSGIHREFNHRVKSVSLATFDESEVKAVRKRGNRESNDLYLALYDPQSDVPEPDGNNTQKRREFIRMKYEEKKWYATPADLEAHVAAKVQAEAEKERRRSSRRRSSGARGAKGNVPAVQPMSNVLPGVKVKVQGPTDLLDLLSAPAPAPPPAPVTVPQQQQQQHQQPGYQQPQQPSMAFEQQPHAVFQQSSSSYQPQAAPAQAPAQHDWGAFSGSTGGTPAGTSPFAGFAPATGQAPAPMPQPQAGYGASAAQPAGNVFGFFGGPIPAPQSQQIHPPQQMQQVQQQAQQQLPQQTTVQPGQGGQMPQMNQVPSAGSTSGDPFSFADPFAGGQGTGAAGVGIAVMAANGTASVVPTPAATMPQLSNPFGDDKDGGMGIPPAHPPQQTLEQPAAQIPANPFDIF
ncbi:unnamed protein product [Chrysoparadoxa australica]